MSNKKVTDNKTSDTSTNTSTNTSIVQLLPCPFCGGEAYEYRSGFQFSLCEIVCKDCGCRTERMAVEEAIAAWNTRKPMERIVERLEEESRLAEEEKERLLKRNPIHFDIARGYANSLAVAIEIVKEEM